MAPGKFGGKVKRLIKMENPQPSFIKNLMKKVQRLDGSGHIQMCSRYSLNQLVIVSKFEL